ncbi:hypothetical protein Pmani_017231 [Petrolisthes manimaculis]|uniref:SMB domain-containing protein n=1 Tax=Petrolisthes manimaculis TaxID=1843537 RepID=A0AAE1UA43_9EUCA|nr:hypothetical protein Pmani_017231 [Petrolisthes manimaculis]
MGWKVDVVGRSSSVLVLFVLPLVCGVGFHGIPGDYCRARKHDECCRERYDDCSVQIGGTLCYCDEFCLNKDDPYDLHDDCCPDYRELCLGILPQPPPEHPWPNDEPAEGPDPLTRGCQTADGVSMPEFTSYKNNCNKCTCKGSRFECEKDLCLVEDEAINKINQGVEGFSWRATNYSKFWGWKAKDGVMMKTGTAKPAFIMYPIHLQPELSLIPVEFDARMKSDWRGMISRPRDQGWCSASWAFSTVAVAQDRLAIMTREHSLVLSVEQMVECVHINGDTCNKPQQVHQAWNYLRRTGVVREECLPYQSGKLGNTRECQVPGGSTNFLQCQNRNLYKMEPAYRISSKEEDIQWEIMSNGPVLGIMRVTPELFMYASGVYTCREQQQDERDDVPLHSVRLIGWGETSLDPGARPTKYWVVANSWGEDWGENGYFKIRRGTDECGIESYILAVRPQMTSLMYGN